jgi:hypothetical protein
MFSRGFVTKRRLEGTIWVPMDFRSHLGRHIDPRHPPNLFIGAIVAIVGGISVILWLNGAPGSIALAPVFAFLIWALLREIDPDHEWSALIGATLAGAWELTGKPSASAFALAGLMLAARLTTHTTGRRPLPIDLGFLTVLGIAIGFTVEGWATGFGIALAIYLDERFRGTARLVAIGASAVTAIGTTVVATLAGAFPERAPDVVEYMSVAAGVAALLLLAREPATPLSQVDARHAAFIDRSRLHVSRSVVGILVFLMTILTGADAGGLVTVIGALGIAVISNEVELIRRRTR